MQRQKREGVLPMTEYETISLMLLFGTLMVSTILGILTLTVELIKLFNEDKNDSETARKRNTKK